MLIYAKLNRWIEFQQNAHSHSRESKTWIYRKWFRHTAQGKILSHSRVWKEGQGTIDTMKIMLKCTVNVRKTWCWPFPQQWVLPNGGSVLSGKNYSVVMHTVVSIEVHDWTDISAQFIMILCILLSSQINSFIDSDVYNFDLRRRQ